MGLTMKERNSVTKETAVRYRNAKKKEKKQILDEYVKLTGFARKYAIAKLNSCIHKREHEYNNVTIKTVKVELPKKKKRIYVPKLEVKAVSTPVFPLDENSGKNLLKLYLNDAGILTSTLYQNNIRPILDNMASVNLGTVYEAVVAQELKAHGKSLFYYDNKTKGEVDFLINDYEDLSIVPIEVKSGKDYTIHSAIDTFISNKDYNVKKAYVLSNERTVYTKNGITYLPVYYVMFL